MRLFQYLIFKLYIYLCMWVGIWFSLSTMLVPELMKSDLISSAFTHRVSSSVNALQILCKICLNN